MSERCKFTKKGRYCVCKVCGLKVEAEDPAKVYAVCPGAPRKLPSIIRQVAHYAEAVAHHVATGMETRTDEEVINILQICETCDQYTEDHRCAVCGCNLSTAKNAFSNKLRMKSQHCPRGLWE